MKAKEVLSTLNISRATLSKYVKVGLIGVESLPYSRYKYNRKDVYKLLNKEERKTVVYARVSTNYQKKQLDSQIELLKSYCFSKGIQIQGVFKDVASGISYDNRKDFFKLLDLVLSYKIERVVITYKDRLSRVCFSLFKNLFNKFGCEIEVVSEVGSSKLDSEEVFEDIVSLLHCYSMKMYSGRKKSVVKDLISTECN